MKTLRNIGPKSWDILFKAGLEDVETIRKIGVVATYAQVREMCPTVSLNLLWALQAGLQNRDWRSLTDAEKAELLHELGD